jgi:hypothetical protein
VTDSSVDLGGSVDLDGGILAAHPLLVPQEQDRRRKIRQTIAVAAVVLVHLLALLLLAISNKLPAIEHIRVTIPESITWIPALDLSSRAPKQRDRVPQTTPEPVYVQPTAPITLPPARHKELAPPATEGLEGVGRSLACGASSYENLSVVQREACRRHPWAFVKRPDGTIVLDVPKGEQPPPPPTTIEILRHQQETAPPCPMLANVPCLGGVIHGAQPTGP